MAANTIAKWNGSAWSALGSGMSVETIGIAVNALAVFDDPFYFGGAIYDDYLRLVTDGEVLQPENNGYEPPAEWVHPGVPEPAAGALIALFGVALSALAAARARSAG